MFVIFIAAHDKANLNVDIYSSCCDGDVASQAKLRTPNPKHLKLANTLALPRCQGKKKKKWSANFRCRNGFNNQDINRIVTQTIAIVS